MPYDPSALVKDVEIDKGFQSELAMENEEAKKRIMASQASDADKQEQLDSLEERMAEKLAEKLEAKLEEKIDQKLAGK